MLQMSHSPTEILGQWINRILSPIEWLFLPNQPIKSLQLYVEQITKIVIIGRNS